MKVGTYVTAAVDYEGATVYRVVSINGSFAGVVDPRHEAACKRRGMKPTPMFVNVKHLKRVEK